MHGEEEIPGAEDWGYGLPQYLTPEQVRAAAAALGGLSSDVLVRDVTEVELAQADLYPNIAGEGLQWLQYVTHHYDALVPFFRAAAAAGDAMVVWLDVADAPAGRCGAVLRSPKHSTTTDGDRLFATVNPGLVPGDIRCAERLALRSASVVEGIVGSLIVAVVLGAGVYFRRWVKRGDPLTVTGEVLVPKAWEMALPSDDALPQHVPQDKRTYMPMYWLLRQRGAADFKATTAKLLVENQTEQPLTITNIKVHKQQIGEPFCATWVRYPPAGAAGAIVLDFLLDESIPEAWEAAYEDSISRLTRTGNRPYFDDNVITLSPGESQSLLITGRAESVRCSWWLQIEVVQAGQRRVVDVVPEGGALLTSGTPTGGFERQLEWSWYEGADASFVPPPWLT
ncbi:hypothetical protein SBD_6221 [Streptomyces bottropensis ATCC 25435]|uniref:Uncharacterized protein n=1 Tax=Streptomyces bottropensis ATCC 25435 TaxID=1054862 RepID=M3FJN7_9ACTN|nr:hypothetical protein SBD_6221 [Streptomyces bottropensis ATCC 25435]